MSSELASIYILDTFWSLSSKKHGLTLRKGVMALLWLMRGPRGLDRTDKI